MAYRVDHENHVHMDAENVRQGHTGDGVRSMLAWGIVSVSALLAVVTISSIATA